jgi:hypothetical protein
MSEVYDKPDRNIAILWQCECSTFCNLAYAAFKNGTVAPVGDYRADFPYAPTEYHGRWRPYVPGNTEPWPPKPPRVKAIRRCMATCKRTGNRLQLSWFPGEEGALPFRSPFTGVESKVWYSQDDVSDLVFIDPDQYLDELGVS